MELVLSAGCAMVVTLLVFVYFKIQETDLLLMTTPALLKSDEERLAHLEARHEELRKLVADLEYRSRALDQKY